MIDIMRNRKKKLPSKKFLLSFMLVSFAVIAFNASHYGSLAVAGTNDDQLDRLFHDMGILKIPDISLPVEIRLKDINGNMISLSDFKGKIVFLNFWATWCLPCIIEMPSMEKLHRKFKDEDFVMVAINLMESEAQVKAFFEKLKLSFTALLDSTGEVAAWFTINAVPTTYILDKQGRVIGKALGPREWHSQESFSLFEYLINNPAGSMSFF
jgi:thiol-disulfide isomerase/thioredoxin